MKLQRRQLGNWPKLSWLARISDSQVSVLHGRRVECSDDWVFEGTWAGSFKQAEFDRSVAAIVGTGLRVRDSKVTFVCSTSPLDRLFYVERCGEFLVSNSLACLLAASRLRLDPAFAYSKTLSRMLVDHRHTPKTLATVEGEEIHVLIHEQLTCDFSGKEVKTTLREPYGSSIPDFATFEDYRQFLRTTMLAIRDNLEDSQRRFPITPVATISKGYDSPASMVVAEPLGIQTALTISRVGIFYQHDDSGTEIAKTLGSQVTSVKSKVSHYRDYPLVWAGLGQYFDLNMTMFDYSHDLTLLTVGTHGDVVWQKGLTEEFVATHHFLDRGGDTSGCGLTEWRLHKGVFLACIPCLGAVKLDCLRLINGSSSMDPWRVGGKYDRPIPRRIVEQRGIDREAFGNRKMATLPGCRMFYPSDPDQLRDLNVFLCQHGQRLPRRFGFLRAPIHILRTKLGRHVSRFQLPNLEDLFFVWANNRVASGSYELPN